MRPEVVAAAGKSLLTSMGRAKQSETMILTLPPVCIIQMRNKLSPPNIIHIFSCAHLHMQVPYPPLPLWLGLC